MKKDLLVFISILSAILVWVFRGEIFNNNLMLFNNDSPLGQLVADSEHPVEHLMQLPHWNDLNGLGYKSPPRGPVDALFMIAIGHLKQVLVLILLVIVSRQLYKMFRICHHRKHHK